MGFSDLTGGLSMLDIVRLAQLFDVNIAAPVNGDALVYNSATGRWVNGSTIPGGGPFVPYTGATADVDLGARNLKMPSGVIQDALSTSSLSPNARQLYNESGTTVAQWGSYGGYLFLNAGLSTDNIIDSTGGSAIGVGIKSLLDGASTSLSWFNRITYDTSGVDSINWEFRRLLDSSANTSVDYSNKELISGGASSLSWSGRIAYDGVGVASLSWGGRELSNSLGRTVYSYELNLMYAFSGVQHAVIDVGSQILYDIADQSSIRWSTRDMYASDGSTVLANYTNSTGMRFYGTVGAGFSSASFTPSARIHAHSLTGIATYQKTTNSATGALSTDGFDVGVSSTGVAEIRQRENLDMAFYTNDILRGSVTSAGNLLWSGGTILPRTGSTTAGTEPLRYTSGALLTAATVGTQEFLTDKMYTTITTGAARKEYTLNDAALTAGNLPVITTNGRLTNSAATGYAKLAAGALSSVTVIPSADGGTGLSTGTPGSIIQHTGSVWARLDAVSPGSYLRTNGTNTALTWSTLKLPNTAGTGRIVYATTADTWGDSANLVFDGTTLSLVGSASILSATANQLKVGYDASNFFTAVTSAAGVTTLAASSGGSFSFSNAIAYPTALLSVSTTLTNLHYTVRVDATGAARIITLPAASGCTGRIYNIKKIDSSANTVTIDGNASETIDGALTVVISVRYQNVQIQSNGTGWDIL